MGKAHENKKETAQSKCETNARAIRRKNNTIRRKQTPPIQSSTQTNMDLWNPAMGEQPPIPTSKTLRSILNAPWYINKHRIYEDLQMNTVLSEIKKWNTNYLRKLENHTNALTRNLLHNSKSTHILKRNTVLALPDRLE
jgi:hypothetical protein